MANGALAGPDPINDDIRANAQNVSQQQGALFNSLATSTKDQPTPDYPTYDPSAARTQIDNTVDFKPAESYIDAARGTVRGQLYTLLAEKSPYMQQAGEQAKEASQEKGQLNTTMAVQAGQRAAIQSALEIARPDAATYAQAGFNRQRAEYGVETIQSEAIVSGEMVKQQAAIDRRNQDINNAFTASLQGASEQSKTLFQGMQNQYNTGLQELQNIQQQSLLSQEIEAEKLGHVRQQSSNIMQNYQISVERLMMDPDFLQMSDTAINNAVNEMQQLAKNSILLIGATANVDMTSYVDAYLTDLDIV